MGTGLCGRTKTVEDHAPFGAEQSLDCAGQASGCTPLDPSPFGRVSLTKRSDFGPEGHGIFDLAPSDGPG